MNALVVPKAYYALEQEQVLTFYFQKHPGEPSLSF